MLMCIIFIFLVLVEFPIVHTLIRRGRKDDAELVEQTGRIVVPILFLSFNVIYWLCLFLIWTSSSSQNNQRKLNQWLLCPYFINKSDLLLYSKSSRMPWHTFYPLLKTQIYLVSLSTIHSYDLLSSFQILIQKKQRISWRNILYKYCLQYWGVWSGIGSLVLELWELEHQNTG